MRDRDLRRALLGVPPPDEIGAQRRTWRLVRAAFDEREPMAWPRRHARPLIAAAAGVAILAAVLSPPGRAVITDVREAIGTEKVAGVPKAKPALFSLPAKGQVLVKAPTGVWVVNADGSRRLLGKYNEASWSPRGLHVVASSRSQLVALTPKGEVRWAIARPAVHDARWAPSGFRVAYLSGANLRVVAGDKTGDRRVDAAEDVAPAWRPGQDHVVAYVAAGGNVTVTNTDTDRTMWTGGQAAAMPQQLEWSTDGKRLLTASRFDAGFALAVFDDSGRRRQFLMFDGELVDFAFAPDSYQVALIRNVGPRSELLIVDADTLRSQETVFSGKGRFADVAWSPDGRWLLLGWESADQWLFIRSTDVEKIKAVSSLAQQFDPGGTGLGPFPRIEGWCCAERATQ